MRRHPWNRWLASALLLLGWSAVCQSRAGTNGAEASEPLNPVPVAEAETTALSYYESRLLEVIQRMNALQKRVREAPETPQREIERPFREIASTFQSIVADNPDGIEARLIYGKFLDFFGDGEGAAEQFMEVLRRDDSVAVAYQQLGTFFAEEGDFGRAMAYYLNAIEKDPDEALYHHGLGELLYVYKPGFLEEAGFTEAVLEEKMLAAFRQAAELEPDSLVYQFRYGEAFYDLREPDWTLALAHWERLQARDDLSPLQADVIKLHRARCLGELERYAPARDLAATVQREGLAQTRDALLTAIAEAESAEAGNR